MFLLDLAYIFLLIIALPFYLKIFFKKDYREQLKCRFSPDISPAQERRVWLHAVSVGEVKSLAGFVSQLEKSFKGDIVLSVTTPSGLKVAKMEFSGLKVINAPLDFSFTIKRFLKKIRPDIIILNELELWPNWITISKKAGIPIVLINGRISDSAFVKYRRFSFFLKPFFSRLEMVMIQGESYREKFIKLGVDPEKIKICGNIKADEAIGGLESIPLRSEIFKYLRAEKSSRKLILFASSHPEDEEFFLPLIKTLSKDFSIIIAPRHIDRIDKIEKSLKREDVKYSVWSKENIIDLKKSVVVFDKMGYLLNLMQIADIVFMGGSFNPKTGGHNLYEPAALGKKIIGGPCYNNFPDIGSTLVDNGVYSIVENHEEMVKLLKGIKKQNIKKVKSSGIKSVKNRTGATKCSIKEIKKLLK
ncbi:MAG: glycosyltransferase N-terminal domain-containing protein [Acidobacteriota bacterium]